jgi:hypothetical protein
MWEWIYQESKKILHYYKLSKEDKDDIVQDLINALFECPEEAEKIYNNRTSNGLGLLKKRIKSSVFAYNAAQFFDTKSDYYVYIAALRVCDKYSISPIPENAYKISPLLYGSVPSSHCSISQIERILFVVKPRIISLDALIDDDLIDASIEGDVKIRKRTYE